MNNMETTILIVEDNPTGACTLHDMLYVTTDDYHLTWTCNLHDAVHEIRRQPWDIIVTKLDLPDSQGYQTFETLKTFCPKASIVVIHDKSDSDVREQIIRNGASAYIVEGETDERKLIQLLYRFLHLTH